MEKKLYRSRTNRMLAFNIVTLIAYIVMIFVVPLEPSASPSV